MKAAAVNLAIAAMWLFLSPAPSLAVFALGYLTGFALLAVFPAVIGGASYVRRTLAFGRFALRFGREFLVANLRVAWAVLARPRDSFTPDFLTYNVSDLSRAEILLLSYCVSLTPGTTTVAIADDFRTVTFHALDAADADEIRSTIEGSLKPWILAFTR